MREHDLQPRHRRQSVVTTDSGHNGPIFPDLACERIVDGPNQLWVADITYIAIATGFVYLAAILDAWSRRVVGYAISRSIDARVAVAARKAAIRVRRPSGTTCRCSPVNPGAPATILTPAALALRHVPIADYARYDNLRRTN